MATAQTVIDMATSLLRVRTSGQSFVTDNPNKNDDCFLAVQDMIAQWGEDSVIDIPVPAALDTTLDIPAGTTRALNWNVAVEIAPQFGRVADGVMLRQAKLTYDRLLTQSDMDISIDMSDLNFSNRGGYDIRSGR